MKVAIIGAGLAGLSCAHELEKLGCKYVIYERNGFIGEQFTHVAALIEVMHRPVKDYIKYFRDEFDIIVKPLDNIEHIIHISPNKTRNINGNLGVLLKRGSDNDSLKNQLFHQLKNPEIKFNTFADHKDLINKFDYVVVATGNIQVAKELGCFQTSIRGIVRGAVVKGDFKTNEMTAWINKEYCKNGYAYLTPFDSKTASIVLVVTYVNEKEIDYFWERFLYTENISYSIIEEFKYEHVGGFGYPNKIGNILLAGNACGIIDPFLGFGAINSISTGVYCARTIAKGKDLEKQRKNLMKKNLQLHEFRKAFDNMSNNQLDILIMTLDFPGIKQIIYNTNIDVVKYASKIVKLINNYDNK